MIGGFTAPRGSRIEFGALLLGYYDGDAAALRGQGRHRLRHARRCSRLGARLRDAAPPTTPPFADAAAIERGVTWVEPKLVAQIGFTEWTRDGRLRHPRFLGLRDDKAAPRWCASR